jgi:hypothetical protein
MVCTVTKNAIEKRGQNFCDHVKEQHMFWKYLYFLIYLEDKNPEDFTGLETAIHDQFLKSQANWVPFEKEDAEVYLSENGEASKSTVGGGINDNKSDGSAKEATDSMSAMESKFRTLESRN